MSASPRHILLLCHFEPGSASTIIEHIQAFPNFSANRYYVLNNLGNLPAWLDLSRFDGLIIHYSLIACYDNYLSPDARRRIREFPGFKAAFVQDDYRWINDTVSALAYMRINALFALAGPEIMDAVYSPERLPGVRRETVLTGYVPEHLAKLTVPALVDRPIDVGYRARKLPAWIGSHTLQKWQIADRFVADAPAYGLKVDISYREDDRIYGDAWIRFVSNCKAVLGTESGASICDFTGDIQRNVEAHLKRDPSASFETLRDLYFKDEDGKIMMNVISPRCFEAAALRTLMILYEGYYSGVLQPWRHYIPLKMDHSNMAEVVRILRDPVESQRIVDTAFTEVALSPKNTFRALIERVDRVIADESRLPQAGVGYSGEEYAWRLTGSRLDMTRYATFTSDVEFEAGRGLAVLPAQSDDPAILSKSSFSPPHVINVALKTRIKLDSVHIVWASLDASAVGGLMECFLGGQSVASIPFQTSVPGPHLRIAVPVALPNVDGLRLTFNGYHGQVRMHLREIGVQCAVIPLAERIRQAKHRLWQWFFFHLSNLWMRLPERLRQLLKKRVRILFETIFGRS